MIVTNLFNLVEAKWQDFSDRTLKTFNFFWIFLIFYFFWWYVSSKWGHGAENNDKRHPSFFKIPTIRTR